MHQPALWLALLDRLAELLQSEHAADIGRNTGTSDGFALQKYQSDYREIHCAGAMQNSTLEKIMTTQCPQF